LRGRQNHHRQTALWAAGTYVKARFGGLEADGREGEVSIVVHPTYVLFHESRLWTRMVAIIRIFKRLEAESGTYAEKPKVFDTAGTTTIKFRLHKKPAV
jgi:hypothetical protein